jgi:myosin heavy subunit
MEMNGTDVSVADRLCDDPFPGLGTDELVQALNDHAETGTLKRNGRPKKLPLVHRAAKGAGQGGKLTCETEEGHPCTECAKIRQQNREAEEAWEQLQLEQRQARKEAELSRKRAREADKEAAKRRKQEERDAQATEKLAKEEKKRLEKHKETLRKANEAALKAQQKAEEKKRAAEKALKDKEEKAAREAAEKEKEKENFSGGLFFSATRPLSIKRTPVPSSQNSEDDWAYEISKTASLLQRAKHPAQLAADKRDTVCPFDVETLSFVERQNVFRSSSSGKENKVQPFITPEESLIVGQMIASHSEQLASGGQFSKSRFAKLDLGFDGHQDSTLTPNMIKCWPSSSLDVLAAIARRLNREVSTTVLMMVSQFVDNLRSFELTLLNDVGADIASDVILSKCCMMLDERRIFKHAEMAFFQDQTR